LAAIFYATSSVRPRADVVYCINAFARRISKTHNWTVKSVLNWCSDANLWIGKHDLVLQKLAAVGYLRGEFCGIAVSKVLCHFTVFVGWKLGYANML
jgi:hypothetical protein